MVSSQVSVLLVAVLLLRTPAGGLQGTMQVLFCKK